MHQVGYSVISYQTDDRRARAGFSCINRGLVFTILIRKLSSGKD